jgi:hypothetical protein
VFWKIGIAHEPISRTVPVGRHLARGARDQYVAHKGGGGSGGLTKILEVGLFSAQISILTVCVAWYCYVLCYYTFNLVL